MKSNYKKLGDYIAPAGELNNGIQVDNLLGISNAKYFQKAKTNTIGINLETYRIVRKGQFAFNRATTRNGDKISIALREESDCIVSPSYRIFEVVKTDELLSEYLMMWFRRPEFDRYARYKSHGSAHEFFEYNEMCEIELPIPSIQKQKEIIKEYHTIEDRIKLNEELNQKLEDTAQSIYKEWFVNFEFPDENGKTYKSNGGGMVYCDELEMEIPKWWELVNLESMLDIKYGKDYKHLNNGEIPLYGSGGIMKYVNKYLYSGESILIPRKGSLNNIIHINQKFWTVDTMFYSIIKTKFSGKYLFHILKSIDFYSLNVGSAVPSMTTNLLNGLKILKPENYVLENFEKALIPIFKHKSILKDENETLEKLKEVLLSKIATIEG
ncbi:restriction endonuclease subunit S [Aliarcobacter butzleri]|uniref:restriction endonuclease subunit S n=1 Tax=Aliarcobacter butzleri TaxID=28197 RepID=UPI00125F0305|nr:restriction endonuclease subunit S [Aliarcobacter butzleri]MCG3650994.1 restriction endonuclease subunit S [Aliarcobacter butzleri]